MTDTALQAMSPLFARLYSRMGRPSIAPEKLLRALLLQALYSVRSERLLMEQLDYNLLFRWFVGMNVDDEVWDVTVFTKNRDRWLEGEIAKVFFALGRTFYGGRHADRSVGQSPQFSPEESAADHGERQPRAKIAARHA